jgi:predicted NAD/FAD-dependent oxidoreductase
VADAIGHRWRFARPIRPSDDGFLLASESPPVLVAGEAFAGARVEGAFRSGLEAAAAALALLR